MVGGTALLGEQNLFARAYRGISASRSASVAPTLFLDRHCPGTAADKTRRATGCITGGARIGPSATARFALLCSASRSSRAISVAFAANGCASTSAIFALEVSAALAEEAFLEQHGAFLLKTGGPVHSEFSSGPVGVFGRKSCVRCRRREERMRLSRMGLPDSQLRASLCRAEVVAGKAKALHRNVTGARLRPAQLSQGSFETLGIFGANYCCPFGLAGHSWMFW